jgi:hypothetical protein
LLSERPYAVQQEALEVLGRDVSVQSRAISVLLPQSKNVCLLLASSDVKGYDACSLRKASRISRRIASALYASSGAKVNRTD